MIVCLQRVTGPDISRLLISDYRTASLPEGQHNTFASGGDDNQSFKHYMQFLLGGHVDVIAFFFEL